MQTWRAWASLLVGAWFVFSAFIFSTSGLVFAMFLTLGGLTFLIALWDLIDLTARPWRLWLRVLLAALLTLSPWLFGFSGQSAMTWITASVAFFVGLLPSLRAAILGSRATP